MTGEGRGALRSPEEETPVPEERTGLARPLCPGARRQSPRMEGTGGPAAQLSCQVDITSE